MKRKIIEGNILKMQLWVFFSYPLNRRLVRGKVKWHYFFEGIRIGITFLTIQHPLEFNEEQIQRFSRHSKNRVFLKKKKIKADEDIEISKNKEYNFDHKKPSNAVMKFELKKIPGGS